MSSDSPASIVPPELWIRVVSLVHKSSIVRICTSAASLCALSRSPIVKLKWTELRIFECENIPAEVSFPFKLPGRPVNHHIARFLKSRLPIALLPDNRQCYASLIAPGNPALDPIFSFAYIDWLFKKGGPLHVASPPDRERLEEQLQQIVSRKGKGSVAYEPRKNNAEDHSHWQPIPDALLLLIYSIRSGQTPLLSRILPHILRLIPKETSLPPLAWANYLLDNRRQIVYSLACDLDANQQESMTFSMFLYWLVVIEWSVPMLAVVDAKLGKQDHFLDLFFNHSDGFFLFLLTKTAPWREPKRILDFLRYLRMGRKKTVVIAAMMVCLFFATALTLMGVVCAVVVEKLSRK